MHERNPDRKSNARADANKEKDKSDDIGEASRFRISRDNLQSDSFDVEVVRKLTHCGNE